MTRRGRAKLANLRSAAKLANLRHGANRFEAKKVEVHMCTSTSVDAAAAKLGVGPRTVFKAKKVLAEAG